MIFDVEFTDIEFKIEYVFFDLGSLNQEIACQTGLKSFVIELILCMFTENITTKLISM